MTRAQEGYAKACADFDKHWADRMTLYRRTPPMSELVSLIVVIAAGFALLSLLVWRVHQ